MPDIINKIKEEIKDISHKIDPNNNSKDVKIEKKLDIEEKINKKSETFGDKIHNFFNKIDILELEQEEKGEVAKKVKIQAKSDKLYWIEIFLSGIIASLGLLQNSVAVIIGAMLIAPFLRPINGIAFGIARGEKKFFIDSIKVLIISSLLSILMGFIVMNLTGLYKETPEILARTSPNIIDLFIAIFSAIVALLSLAYKRLGESVAGVAMAASLMPPLGVIGMELALGNYNLAWGASMLFITNIIAIILVGIGAFWLYGFTPHNGGKQKKAFLRIFMVIILILLISVPLVKNLLFIRDKEYIEKKVNANLENILNKKISNFKISEVNIKEISNNKIKIKIILKLKEGIKFYNIFKDYLEEELSNKIGREVNIDIELGRIIKIIDKKEEEKILENIKNKNIEKIKNKEKLEKESFKKQEEYINIIKIEFQKEINKKLEEEKNIKLKSQLELEQKLKKEFNNLLEKKISKIEKANISKNNIIENTATGKIDKNENIESEIKK